MSSFEEKRKFVDRLYQILIESNLKSSEDELWKEYNNEPDVEFDHNLKFIKQLNTKAKASLQKARYETAKQELAKLLSKSGKSIKELLQGLNPNESYNQLQALYRKYEKHDENDYLSMLSDKKILEILEELRKMDSNENSHE